MELHIFKLLITYNSLKIITAAHLFLLTSIKSTGNLTKTFKFFLFEDRMKNLYCIPNSLLSGVFRFQVILDNRLNLCILLLLIDLLFQIPDLSTLEYSGFITGYRIIER